MEDSSSSQGTRSGASQSSSGSGNVQSAATGSGQSSASSSDGSATVTTSGSGGSAMTAGSVGSTSSGQGAAGGAVGTGGAGQVAVVTGGMITGGPTFGGVGGMPGVTVATVTGGTIWPEHIPIPEDCRANGSSVDPYNCYLELTCDSSFTYSYCSRDGDSFRCECDNGRKWNSFQLWGTAEAEACQYAASLCLAEPEPEFSDSDCKPTFLEAGAGYCSSEVQCTEALKYEGIRVTRDEWRYVQCSDNMAQGARCDCQFNEGYLSFDLPESSVSSTLCTNVVAGCSGELVEPQGNPMCAQAFQSASQDYCNAELDCTQQALLGGEPAVLHQRVPVNCFQNASGTWLCDCPLAGSFEVAEASAWDACISASELCASGS